MRAIDARERVGIQAATECIEDDRAGVAVMLVVPRYDYNGLSISLEPSQPFIKPVPCMSNRFQNVQKQRSAACKTIVEDTNQRMKELRSKELRY